MPTKIVGILNCSPDSFSDGTGSVSHAELLERAKRLVDEGADILDIGGDSTRPGSECPGVEEEWRRIEPVVREMATHIPCSVDTHHVEVARRAIEWGATFINDISGSPSNEMIDLIASTQAAYIFMHNAHGAPHTFGPGLTPTHAFTTISSWIQNTIEVLTRRGISPEKLIADPGMGAFIGKDPEASWQMLSRFHELPAPQGGLLLGCSRKGFLATDDESTPQGRDERSCREGARAVMSVAPLIPTYLRVHNVAMQRDVLSTWNSINNVEDRGLSPR